MGRTPKLKPGTLVQVVESGADKYDSQTRDNDGFVEWNQWPMRDSHCVWRFGVPGMIIEMKLRYVGDPYPAYRVLVGEDYFLVPTRYLKALESK